MYNVETIGQNELISSNVIVLKSSKSYRTQNTDAAIVDAVTRRASRVDFGLVTRACARLKRRGNDGFVLLDRGKQRKVEELFANASRQTTEKTRVHLGLHLQL